MNQQRYPRDRFHVLLAPAFDGRVGNLFEKDLRLAIEYLVPLQDGSLPNRLRQMAFAGAARARNIMPMVPRSSRFITLFTHYTVRAFALNGGRSSQRVSTFSASCPTAPSAGFPSWIADPTKSPNFTVGAASDIGGRTRRTSEIAGQLAFELPTR